MADLAIRAAQRPAVDDALWAILERAVWAGTTYPVDPAASREEVFACWFAPGNLVVATKAAAVHLWQSVAMAEVGHLPQAFRLPDGRTADVLVMDRKLEVPR